MTLLLHHARFRFLESIREPVATVSSLLFPALFMVMFSVASSAVRDSAEHATASAGQMAFFALASAFAFNLGIGVAVDRDKPWELYVRALPVGAGAVLGGRLLNAAAIAVLSLVPVALVAGLLTEAHATPPRLVAALPVLLGCGLPFVFLGLAIGHSLPMKAAIPVVQLIMLPGSFLGGLWMPPSAFPAWLDPVSQALPTRAGRELVLGALTGTDPGPVALPVAIGWTVLLGALAVAAYRRDEGRRFR
ncbi:ABC transporter permease [Saccharopolyspora taberi]|uniref:ABC transporter permease n=1 Tax=Saccharopolyspora taberi TaxID=60895 RepID=A0ABN3V6T8_9PSEU